MLKIKGLVLFAVSVFLLQSCGGDGSSRDIEKKLESNQEEGVHANASTSKKEVSSEKEHFNFKSDNDVLTYLIGKQFDASDSDLYMKFETYGADVSGTKYEWINHTAISKNKAFIKLASTSTINPDCVITVWIDCHLHTVTDGETVLMYN